jgi:hypothetical protein
VINTTKYKLESVGLLSNLDEVSDLFRGILNESKARTETSGLEHSSFSCDLPVDGRARISGYLHTNKHTQLRDSAVWPWIFDDRIIGEIVWTRFCGWQKWELEGALSHQERPCSAAGCDGCDGGTDNSTSRLENWVGKSLDEIDRRGSPTGRHLSADQGQAGGGCSEAASGAAAPPPRGCGRPARPAPVA